MKKIILSICLFIGVVKAYSQANINADCGQAIPLCTTPNFTFNATSGVGNVQDIPSPSNISNPTTNPASANSGCLLSGELKPQWLLITIANPGNLEFVFGAATSANPQAGFYDWAMWPYSTAACAGIANNTLPPIRCNWNGTSIGGTGIASAANIAAVGGNASNFEPPLAVNACQQFIICISNFSGISTLVSFQSLGTASLSCNPNCNPNYTICAGSSAMIVPVNFAALTNPSYSLIPGPMSNTTGSFVVSPLTTTTYTTFITGMNSNNAVQTITATSVVNVNPQPAAAPTVTQSTCTNTLNGFNLGLTFTPASPVPAYTVNYSPIPNNVTNNTQTSATGGIAPGIYNATITAAGGCSTTTSFNINPSLAPAVFNIAPNGTTFTVTCAQPTVVINATPATYNYTWTNGVVTPQTGPTGNFTGLTLGNWTLTGVNPTSGCSASQTFTVFQNVSVPTSSVAPLTQNITCNLASVTTVTGTATSPTLNITHQWISPSGGTLTALTPTAIYQPGSTGTYTHCIVNNVNGCSSCSTFTVNSLSAFPTYSVTSPQQFTLGCGTTSITTISISNVNTYTAPNTAPTGGPVSYTLLPPSYAGPSYTLGTLSVFSVSVAGTYTVITKDNTNSCETHVQVSVISNTAAPSVTATAVTQTLSCYTPKTILQGLSGTPNVAFSWAFAGPPAGQLPNDTMTIYTTTAVNTPSVGTYTLSVTDNINKCRSTQTLTIYQDIKPPIPIINPTGTVAITCGTPTINLTNGSTTAPSVFTHPLSAVGYSWTGPSPQQPLQNSSTYIAETPGTYTLLVKDLNNGCFATTTKNVVDNRVYPNVSSPPSPFILDCGPLGTTNATIFPVLTGTTTGFQYLWIAVPTVSFGPLTSSITTVNKPGRYKIMVTNPTNSCVAYGDVDVINGSLTGDFTPNPSTGYAPLNVTFTNLSASSSSTTPTASITTAWSFGNGQSQITNSVSVSPNTTYTNAGTYTVTMYVVKGTCTDTVQKVITVELPSKLEVPNVFTPNGDGSNDVFFLKVSNVSEITAKIFDRWGNQVYETTSSTGNIQWDGKTMGGKDAAAGTYFYIIKATGKDGTEYDKKGNVSIYR